MSEELDNIAVPETVQDDKAAVREANKLRKRAQRAREKAEKELKAAAAKIAEEREKMKKFQTPLDFWLFQRGTLPSDELQAKLARSEELWSLHEVMDDYIRGTDGTSQADLLDTIAEVRREFPHGFAPLPLVLVERFWMTEVFQSVCSLSEAADTFARYGLLSGLPDSETTQRFIQKFCPDLLVPKADNRVLYKVSDRQEWASVECSKCPQAVRHLSRRAVPAGMYTKERPFVCYNCLAQDSPWKVHKQAQPPQAPDASTTIFDQFGRLKT